MHGVDAQAVLHAPADVGAAEGGLHGEAVGDLHLAEHDYAPCRLLALAHRELTAAERELVRRLNEMMDIYIYIYISIYYIIEDVFDL